MATLNELQDALVNAHNAGDIDAARKLAAAIVEMKSTKSQEPAVVAAGREINSIPRQLGLTARYALEGPANAAQIITEPLRYLTDMVTPDRHLTINNAVPGATPPPKSTPLGVQATKFADWLGLPKPEGATERVVGEGSKLLSGSAATLGMANAAPASSAVANFFRQAPLNQLTSAVGAGVAGQSSKEAGGGDMQQIFASVLGGLAGGFTPDVLNKASQVVSTIKNSIITPMTPQQMDVKISGILQSAGVDYAAIPEKAKQAIRAELSSALKADKELDPAAVARMADFKRNGLTPTRGMVTLDPIQITREQNLAKTAANSSDGELHGLPRLYNQNNSTLIRGLNEAGANVGDINAAGNVVTSSILGRQAGLRSAEQSAWDAAKSSPGYKQPVSSKVISDINATLADEGMMPFMSPEISRYMAAFQGGQPFTPQHYRNLQSMLAREAKKGGNEGYAASLAQRVLGQSELKPAGFADTAGALVTQKMASGMQNADNAATDAIDAVNSARAATKRAYGYEESTPLVRSVLSDGATSDPQRIAQRYIIGGTQREAVDLARQVGPAGRVVIKNALVSYLKERAINGSADEVGKFSQSAFNKALRDLKNSGKLSIFFSKEEIDQLESMGRAASYMQVQPVGSAVNNSNSGAMMVGKAYDALRSGVMKLPYGGPLTMGMLDVVANPIKAAANMKAQSNAQRLMPGLLQSPEASNMLANFAAPGVMAGGLLAAPQ